MEHLLVSWATIDFDILTLTMETRMVNGDDRDARSMRQDPCW
jgi:hypothetical protein